MSNKIILDICIAIIIIASYILTFLCGYSYARAESIKDICEIFKDYIKEHIEL